MNHRRARPTLSFLLRAAPAVGLLVTWTAPAGANPRALPFTYPYETLSEEEMELEQYVDASPLRAETATGSPVWELGYSLQTELEYGISDRLELGLYLVFANEAGGPLVFDGTKQRLRLRLAEEGEWPVDVTLYGEIAEFHDELELEQKIILQKRWGRWRLVTNVWFEEAFARFQGTPELFFRPTIGVTGEISPSLHAGIEYWGVGRFDDKGTESAVEAFNDDFHHYVGPTLLLQFGKLWWTLGAYYRMDATSRTTETGDVYGHVWVRTVVGLLL